MRRLVLLMALCICLAEPAQARWGSSSGGGHSRASSGKHVAPGTYVEKKCKTAACFKKHPAGHYGFVAGQRKPKSMQ